MARRRRPEKREILPDPKFGDIVLSKFMNSVMLDGKKSVAEGIVYGALESVESRLKREPIGVFHDALNNVKPGIEVRSRRVGGATYQVPVEVRPERAQALAIRWLITAARARSEKTMAGAPFGRADGRLAEPRQRGEEARRHAPHGRSEPRLQRTTAGNVIRTYIWGSRIRRLPTSLRNCRNGPQPSARTLSQHRHHGAHRRRQDDDDRAHPLLHRQVLQDRRSPRGHRHDGLDGAGAGARDHDHVGRDDLLLGGEATGPSTASTSSTRRATSTSPSRSSVRLRVLDGAVACFDGVAGVEPQSETVWRQAEKYKVPRMCFVNKLDRTGANFDMCVGMIKDRLGARPAVLYLPIGIEGGFKGLVDLVENRAIIWLDESLGAKFEYQDIPADLDGRRRRSAHGAHRDGRRAGRRRRWRPISKATSPTSRRSRS